MLQKTDTEEHLHPELIFDAATAFWRSSVLFAACRLGLFDLLEKSPATVPEVAAQWNASERGVQGLLDSCATLGFLTKNGDHFGNTASSSRYLTQSGPESLTVTLALQAATYPMWSRLADSVISGRPAIPPGDWLGGDPSLTRQFVIGMRQRALGVARGLIPEVSLAGRTCLADIGGGPGAYAVLFARQYPQLRVRVMDLPPILAIAREFIATTDVADRIETLPCDATRDPFGSGFDAALLSGIVHRMTPAQCRSIFARVHQSLPHGGLIIVNDLFSSDNGPEMAVLFGLQMLLTTETGKTHDAAEMAMWLRSVGFENIRTRTLPPPLPHTLVMGVKGGPSPS